LIVGVHRPLSLRRKPAPATVAVPLPRDHRDDQPLFEFDDVTVVRGQQEVLRIDHLALAHRGSTAIVGPSGSGKSTLLRLCNRLEQPASGTVRFHGSDVARMDPQELRREVAMVFQQPVALPGTVADNVRAADPAISDDALRAALDRVGLPADLARRDAGELSGGERQRVALARSLATDPSVVLLDEATSALDPANAARIEELVAGLVAHGIHAVWVSHDLDELDRIADHVLVVISGRVAQHGPLEQVRRAPDPEVDRFLRGDLR
jgi:putative ABC transport system ATP-binding protein